MKRLSIAELKELRTYLCETVGELIVASESMYIDSLLFNGEHKMITIMNEINKIINALEQPEEVKNAFYMYLVNGTLDTAKLLNFTKTA